MNQAFFIPEVLFERVCHTMRLVESGVLPGVRFNGKELVTSDPDFGSHRLKLFTKWTDCAFYLGPNSHQLFVVEIDATGDNIYVRPAYNDEIEANRATFTRFWGESNDLR